MLYNTRETDGTKKGLIAVQGDGVSPDHKTENTRPAARRKAHAHNNRGYSPFVMADWGKIMGRNDETN